MTAFISSQFITDHSPNRSEFARSICYLGLGVPEPSQGLRSTPESVLLVGNTHRAPSFPITGPVSAQGPGRGEKGLPERSGAHGFGLLGPQSEPREQRKSCEIKTNAVCGNTKTRSPGHPVPAKGSRPHPLQGRGPRGRGGWGRAAAIGPFPPGPPAAGLARVSIACLARAHAGVCACTRPDARAQAQNLSPKPGVGEAAGPCLRPSGSGSAASGEPYLGPSPSAASSLLPAADSVISCWLRPAL